MRFVGRHRELAVLDSACRGPAGALVPIYGRRRIGKSSLLLRFLQDRPGLYFVGKQAPAQLQLREFQQVTAALVGEPLLAEINLDSWRRGLELLVDRWNRPEKLVIALDEFQWTVAESPELPSVLQELWDRSWSGPKGPVLVLCGSYVGFMEREVLGRESPLFGRRTAQIHVKPFTYREATKFQEGRSLTEAARVYFICGGVPQYLQAFEPDRSVDQNVQRQLLDEFSPLHREPEFLLRAELREVPNYYALLTALATGSASHRELARQTGIPERSLPYYLGQLIDLGYVRRRYPLTERPPVGRHVRFALEDALLRYWFRFVFPNQSQIAQLGPERAYLELIKPQAESYYGACFAGLCREALPYLYHRESVSAAFKVGEYWDKGTQIDVVGLRADNWTDLGECRWGAVPSLGQLAAELAERARRYPNERNATIGRRLFLRQAADRPHLQGVRIHDLEDLYRD